jgi:hypothetical protein
MALAQIPRTRPPRPLPPGVRRAVIAGALVAAAAAVGWALTHFPRAGAP